EQRDRDGGVIAEMEHRNGQYECQVEPVGDVDVRLLAPHDGAKKDQEISHPDDGQPEIGVPLWLRIFLRLGNSKNISGAGDDDEEIVAKHDEPWRNIADKPGPTGSLHNVKRRPD